MLNHEKFKKYLLKIIKIKAFIDNYNWEGINYPPEKDDWKRSDKNNLTSASNVLYVKKEKYILFMFENITQIVKSQLIFYEFQTEKDSIILQ